MGIKTHTDLSPSNAERWMNCPGSVALCATMPKPAQSGYAAEGEAAHELLEKCLKNPGLNPYDMVDDEHPEEMAEAVSFALEVIRAEIQKGGSVLIETKVEIAPGISGTLDVGIVRPYDSVTVIDFKYGKGVLVRAVDNPQLLMYAMPLAIQNEVQSIRLMVIQPRAEEQVSTWDCDMQYMETFAAEVERKIALTKEPSAPVCAGTWCKWCWAKAVCPALRNDISNNLPAIPGKELLFPNVKGLSVQTVKNILDYKDRIEDWLGAVAAYATEVLEAGGAIPGWELAQKRANRRWKSEEEALKAFQDLGDAAFKVAILSPAAMEKLVGKERVAPLTEIPDNGTTLKKIKETKNGKPK